MDDAAIDAPGLHRSKEAVEGNIAKLKLPAQRLREGERIDLKADVLPIAPGTPRAHYRCSPHHQGLRAKALGRDQNPKGSRAQAPRHGVTLTVPPLPFFQA